MGDNMNTVLRGRVNLSEANPQTGERGISKETIISLEANKNNKIHLQAYKGIKLRKKGTNVEK
jgi:hypothetical protein